MSVPEVPRRLIDSQAVMPTAPPLISCLMLTRGRIVPTRFAIDCYRRQTWPNRELVIVCDDPDSPLPDFIATLGDPTIRYVLTARDVIGALRNVTIEFLTWGATLPLALVVVLAYGAGMVTGGSLLALLRKWMLTAGRG